MNLSSETDYYRRLDSTFHDHFPFIWKEYEKLGYVTMYQEDLPQGTAFNYLKKGFHYFPTALYGRAYWLKYYETKSSPNKCNYKQPLYLTWLNRIEEFVTKMHSNKVNRDTPFFSFNFQNEYTHDYFAIPKGFDSSFKEMLSKLDSNGYLNYTMLIVMGDHGSRFNYYAHTTESGKLEHKLPFFSIRLPQNFKNTDFLRNVLNNRGKLVSFFDVYQTLRHYLHLNKYGMNQSDACRKRFSLNSVKERNSRGMSLFNEIPLQRSCTDAFIPEESCSCLKDKQIDEHEFKKNTGETILSANLKITEYINNLTESNRNKCAAFKFSKMATLKRVMVDDLKLFKSVVILQPGEAWFEAKFSLCSHN